MKKSLLLLFVLLLGCQEQNLPTVSDDNVRIGFIGCSNTGQTIDGYHAVGGKKFWAIDRSFSENKGNHPPFGGGTVNIWSNGVDTGNEYWTAFDAYLAKYPDTKKVWWQLCIRRNDNPTYEQARLVLDAVRKRIPGVMMYVSPLPPFAESLCGITGVEGIKRAHALAEELAHKEADVLLGPMMLPLKRAERVSDGCHLTVAGQENVGQQMKAFFDK